MDGSFGPAILAGHQDAGDWSDTELRLRLSCSVVSTKGSHFFFLCQCKQLSKPWFMDPEVRSAVFAVPIRKAMHCIGLADLQVVLNGMGCICWSLEQSPQQPTH